MIEIDLSNVRDPLEIDRELVRIAKFFGCTDPCANVDRASRPVPLQGRESQTPVHGARFDDAA